VAVRLFYIWPVTSIFGFNIADSTLTCRASIAF
jgi:hypothetical protein